VKGSIESEGSMGKHLEDRSSFSDSASLTPHSLSLQGDLHDGDSSGQGKACLSPNENSTSGSSSWSKIIDGSSLP
jgi:hypothetical protein